MKVSIGLQQTMSPGKQERAGLLLRDLVTGYYRGDPHMPHPWGGTFVLSDTKTHLLVPYKSHATPICHCPHVSHDHVYISMHPVIDLVECGNCKRIFLSLVRKAFYGN